MRVDFLRGIIQRVSARHTTCLSLARCRLDIVDGEKNVHHAFSVAFQKGRNRAVALASRQRRAEFDPRVPGDGDGDAEGFAGPAGILEMRAQQVGIAKRLNLNQLTYVAKITELDLAGGTITVERRAEGGIQLLQTRLPALVTMLEATNEMRRGSIESALQAARAEVITWNAGDVAIEDLTKCGLRGSPTIVKKVFAPSARSEKAHLVEADESPDARAAALIDEIFRRQPAIEQDLLEFAANSF